jgi:hypothetical protein
MNIHSHTSSRRPGATWGANGCYPAPNALGQLSFE